MALADFAKRIRDLRDDITVEAFGGFGKQNREASMCLARLDEAEMWLLRHGVSSGQMLLIDKAEYRQGLDTITTVTTDGGS